MKKRILNIVLAVVLALSCMQPLCAAAGANGWTVTYSGDTNIDREKYFANVSNSYKFSGDMAMLIKYPGAQVPENYVEIKSAVSEKMTAGRYTLTFYNKGAKSSLTEICIGDNICIGYSDMTNQKISAADSPSGESNWYRYTYTFDYTEQNTDYILFRYHGGTQSTAIDDVSLVPEGGTNNLIADSGFEGVTGPVDPNEPYDITEYQATELMVSPGAGKLCLSWVNPVTSELKNAVVYDITGGSWQYLADVDAEPGRISYCVADGLTNGKVYQYAVVFNYKTKPNFTYYLTGSPTMSDSAAFGGWTVQDMKSGTAGYCPGTITLETDDSGNAYAKVRSNIDNSIDENLNGNIYIKLWQNVKLEAETKYRLTLRAKSDNVQRVTMLMGWNGFEENNGWTVPSFVGTKDWTEYTFTYTTTQSIPQYFQILMEYPGTLYLDDISLKKLENGETAGEELITDGGFESMKSSEVGAISSAEFGDIGQNEMTLNWSSDAQNIKKINLYQKVFDKYEYRGMLDIKNTSLKLENLDYGTEYSYMLAPVNNADYEGQGIEVSATTDLPEYEITAPKLYKGNTSVNLPRGEGTYTVRSTVKNYKIENMKYTQVVAVYKNDALEKLYLTKLTLSIKVKADEAENVETTFTIDSGSGYSFEVFILDSMENMNIISPYRAFK